MLGWFRDTPKIPDGMVRLNALPIDEEGAPTWNNEVETAAQRFAPEFVAPFMFEITPGDCIGGFAAKARLQTPVRVYEARATLIQRRNDEFRTTVVVTAPSAPARDGGDPWSPYTYKRSDSLPKEYVHGLVNSLRQLCEQCHADELRKRKEGWYRRRNESGDALVETKLHSAAEADSKEWNVLKDMDRSINEIAEIFDNLSPDDQEQLLTQFKTKYKQDRAQIDEYLNSRNKLFSYGRQSTPAAKWGESARLYDPSNFQQFVGLLKVVEEILYALRNDRKKVEAYACFACEIAVYVRAESQVDLCNLTHHVEHRSLSPSHPVRKAVPLLDMWIARFFESIATVSVPTHSDQWFRLIPISDSD
jgi:hypothetical protein